MDEHPSASPGAPVVEKLVAKHETRIRRFIASRSGPAVLKKTTLEDLFQDTVAKALASAATFEYYDDVRFIAWIRTIARRTIAGSVAGERRRPDVGRIRRAGSSGAGVSEDSLPFRGRTPLSSVAAHERKSVLTEAIKTLPQDYRQVLTLYKLQELPLGTVAKEMQRSKGATCRLIARAMHVLGKRLEAVDGIDAR